MKGLKEYLRKHGKHFTVELACSAVKLRWKPEQVMKAIKDEVWYNVSESTFGDIVFLVNLAGFYQNCFSFSTKHECIKYALGIVGNMDCNGMAFDNWLSAHRDDDLDISAFA